MKLWSTDILHMQYKRQRVMYSSKTQHIKNNLYSTSVCHIVTVVQVNECANLNS